MCPEKKNWIEMDGWQSQDFRCLVLYGPKWGNEDKVHEVEDIEFFATSKKEINASWNDYNYKDVSWIPTGLHYVFIRDKIKRSEMIVDHGDGGQKMFDIMTFNKSLKVAWIVNYIFEDC